jgi:hypothetical protein
MGNAVIEAQGGVVEKFEDEQPTPRREQRTTREPRRRPRDEAPQRDTEPRPEETKKQL